MPEAPFDVRLVAYAPKGARLGLMPEPLELQAGFPANDVGALTASYSRHTLGGELLDRALSDGLELATEVTDHDGAWVEPRGGRFVWVARSGDLADRAGVVKITAPSWGWLLGRARLLSLANLLPPEHSQAGRRPFYSATAGMILRTLMQENAARGGVPVTAGFQTTTDSAGAAWAKVATLYLDPGLDLATVLGSLTDQGMCDWATVGRELRLWNPDTVLAPDRSQAVRLHLGLDVGESPSTESIEDVVSRVLLRGDDMTLTLDNPAAPTPWGAWEGYLSQGGVSDPGTATQLVQTELDRRARTTAQYTRGLILPGARRWPLVDYEPGAWITAPTSVPAERVRVAQITITKGADGVGGSVVLNDRVLDAELRRAKRINGIVGGSQADGGSGVRPAPEGPDRRTPAAPLGLVVDTDAYLDPAGIARGLVTAGWSDVTAATDGTAMEIAGYDLALRDNVAGAPWVIVRSTELTTATYGPAEVGRAMQAKVRARGRYSTVPGAWSATVTFTVEDDVTAPPVPTVPTVAVDRAVVQVRWDGRTAGGGTMPADFHRVELERAAAAGQVAGTILDAIGGTVLIAYLPYGQAQRFRARAVDRSGNASAWSGWSAYVTPDQLVGGDLAEQSISAGHIMANAIQADHMSVGALDGYIITGATIRTAATGARVELAGTTLRAYNAAGTVTAEISGASSTFTGSTFRTSATPTTGGVIIDATGLRAYNTSGAVTAQIAAASSTITGGTVQSTASAVGTGSGYRVSGTTYQAWNGTSRVAVTPTAYSAVPGILMHYGGAVAGMLYGPAANQVTLAYTDSTNYATFNKDGIYIKASNNSTQPTYDRVLQATNRVFAASGIFHQTTTQPANLNCSSATGTVYRVESLRRAKLLIDDAPDDWADLVYRLRPVTWYDRGAYDRYADELTAVANGELDTPQGSSIIGRRIPGFVAEEVEAAGLAEFCTYDDDGNLTGLAYDRIVAAVIPALRDLHNRVTALEAP